MAKKKKKYTKVLLSPHIFCWYCNKKTLNLRTCILIHIYVCRSVILYKRYVLDRINQMSLKLVHCTLHVLHSSLSQPTAMWSLPCKQTENWRQI